MRVPSFALAASLVLVAGALDGCSSQHAAAAASEAHVAITGKAVDDYYCAPDPKIADRIAQTLAEADEDAYQDAIAGALPIKPGTRVEELQRTAGRRPKVQVRIDAGLYRDDTCWYPANVKGILLPRAGAASS